MTKNKAIVKFAIIGVLVVIGILMSFVRFDVPAVGGGTWTYIGFWGAIENKMGIDLQGGVLAVFDTEPGASSSAIDATVTRLERQLAQRGFVEATVVRQGTQIRVEAPGVHDPDELFEAIGTPAEIDFRTGAGTEADIFLSGEHLESARVVFQGHQEGFGVEVTFTGGPGGGGQRFRDAVQQVGVGGQILIFANGEQISNPTINDATVGANNTAVITLGRGSTQAQADRFRIQIESGLFEVRLDIAETANIPPTLGQGALRAGIIAFLVALVFIFLFMYFLYRDMGLLSNLSLLVYAILFLGALAVVEMVQLTLPGIAGIILALAMAVDANIIIFERIKDEYKSGKRLSVAVESGFNKSVLTIVDANITTIIAAGALFFFGTGAIQGFAVTLLLGVIISMFCSLVILRSFAKLYLYINPHNSKRLRLSQLKTLSGEEVKPVIKKQRKLNLGDN